MQSENKKSSDVIFLAFVFVSVEKCKSLKCFLFLLRFEWYFGYYGMRKFTWAIFSMEPIFVSQEWFNPIRYFHLYSRKVLCIWIINSVMRRCHQALRIGYSCSVIRMPLKKKVLFFLFTNNYYVYILSSQWHFCLPIHNSFSCFFLFVRLLQSSFQKVNNFLCLFQINKNIVRRLAWICQFHIFSETAKIRKIPHLYI